MKLLKWSWSWLISMHLEFNYPQLAYFGGTEQFGLRLLLKIPLIYIVFLTYLDVNVLNFLFVPIYNERFGYSLPN